MNNNVVNNVIAGEIRIRIIFIFYLSYIAGIEM